MATGDGSYLHRRLSRRRVLSSAALGGTGLAAAAAVGCAEEKSTTPPGASPGTVAKEPRRGGTIAHGHSGELRGQGLDPHRLTSTIGKTLGLVYQGLVGYDLRTGEPKPELAQKWEQPSQTDVLFTLQPGVKWQNKPPANGREFSVDDVLFTLQRIRTEDPRFVNSRSIIRTVDRIEATDRATLKVTTKGADAALMMKFAADPIMILAPEVVEKADKFASADAVVGTGAFIMNSYKEQVGAEYVRNPDYWKRGLPYLDAVRTVLFRDDQARWAAFLAGQMDIVFVPGSEVKRYVAQQGGGYSPDWVPLEDQIPLTANSRVKPMDDRRVTKALRLLIDHQEFITAWAEVWFGRGRHGHAFPTSLAAWDFSHEEYERILEWKQPKDEAIKEAQALLGAAGFNRDNPLQFEFITMDIGYFKAGTELAQAQWRKFSQGVVDAKIKVVDSPTSARLRARREFVYMKLGGAGSHNEPDAWLSEIYRSGGPINYAGISDPLLDALIDRQRTIFNADQRKALVKEILKYLLDHSPGTIDSNRFLLNGVNPKLRGHAPEYFLNGRQYERVWLDI